MGGRAFPYFSCQNDLSAKRGWHLTFSHRVFLFSSAALFSFSLLPWGIILVCSMKQRCKNDASETKACARKCSNLPSSFQDTPRKSQNETIAFFSSICLGNKGKRRQKKPFPVDLLHPSFVSYFEGLRERNLQCPSS